MLSNTRFIELGPSFPVDVLSALDSVISLNWKRSRMSAVFMERRLEFSCVITVFAMFNLNFCRLKGGECNKWCVVCVVCVCVCVCGVYVYMCGVCVWCVCGVCAFVCACVCVCVCCVCVCGVGRGEEWGGDKSSQCRREKMNT